MTEWCSRWRLRIWKLRSSGQSVPETILVDPVTMELLQKEMSRLSDILGAELTDGYGDMRFMGIPVEVVEQALVV